MNAPSALLALDIGGTTIRAALVEKGRLSSRVQLATPKPSYPDDVLEAAISLARPLAKHATALGIACAGAVAKGKVTATATHTFPNWIEIELAKRLQDALNLPAVALNDARAAAWGEFAAGAGRGSSEFMFITVSTGVGAGLVLNKKLHLAANGLDAELGFVSVPAQWAEGRPIPNIGPLSALEFETSGTALNQQAKQLGFENAKELCDKAEQGDLQAEQQYSHSAALIAWKIADIAALLGVTQVALGGSVGLRTGYLERVQQHLQAFPKTFQPHVVHAQLGADAGLLGAALWAAEQEIMLAKAT